MEAAKPQHVKKGKKKPAFDSLKQVEKKRRRLEKALAASAAIRSELEKKKQMKKEEQERLDEEGAAIAEAVALQVLIGEDSLDSSELAVDKDEEFNSWYSSGRVDLLMGSSEFGSSSSHEDLTKYPFQSMGWIPSAFSYDSKLSYLADSDSSSAAGFHDRSFYWPSI